MKLLSFGEIVWDVHGDNISLGGAPLNLAVHSAMNGADAFLVSAVGNDPKGRRAVRDAQSFSVNTDHVFVSDTLKTAECTVTDGDNGLPSYKLMSHASFDEIQLPIIEEYMDVICFGTLALRYSHNRNVISQLIKNVPHGHVFCDVNLRAPFYCKETVEYCFKAATIVKVSNEELPSVSYFLLGREYEVKESAERLCSVYRNIGLFIVTLGADGSLCFDKKSGIWYSCKAEKVGVVSTVGAGDSFSAAFLTRYISGWDIPSCLEHASLVSALVCSSENAFSKDMEKIIRSL